MNDRALHYDGVRDLATVRNLSKFLQSHAQPSDEFGPMLASPKMYSSRLIRLGFIEETRSTDLWPTLRSVYQLIRFRVLRVLLRWLF
jgi:hypothetical protein